VGRKEQVINMMCSPIQSRANSDCLIEAHQQPAACGTAASSSVVNLDAERRKAVRVLTDMLDAAYKRGDADQARRYWRELGNVINPEAT
jgi:hypothetical protein